VRGMSKKDTSKAKTKKEAKHSKRKTTKRTVKKQKEKILKDAPVEHYFILYDGEPVKNVKELADTLERIRDDIFYHHVNDEKHDFANWVRDVFEDDELATELKPLQNKDHVRIAIYRHLVKKLSR